MRLQNVGDEGKGYQRVDQNYEVEQEENTFFGPVGDAVHAAVFCLKGFWFGQDDGCFFLDIIFRLFNIGIYAYKR